jgi:glycosyltransferase involved in cell wall biosynthesis
MVVSLRPLPKESFIVERLRFAKIPVETLGMTKWTPFRGFRFRKMLREFRPDIVHAHLIHANLLSRLFKAGGVPVVNTVHIAERRPGKTWHFLWDHLTLGRCTAQTAVSRAVSDFHAEKLGVPFDSFTVIYNGIEPPKPLSSEEKTVLRTEWGIGDCKRVIGSVGRLDLQKGYDLLLDTIEVLDYLIPNGERWGVVLIGDGPERKELEDHVAQQNLKKIVVRFPGFRSDADRAMGAFDLFVMPSRYEGFGLTLLEAMNHGLPVLASDADSLPELLEGYERGQIVRFLPGNETETAEAICEMAIGNRGQNGEKSVLSDERKRFFSGERMASEYVSLYEKVIAQGRDR